MDLNHRHLELEANALPTELHPRTIGARHSSYLNGNDSSPVSFTGYLLSQVDRITPAAGCSGIQLPGIPCLDSDTDGFVPATLAFSKDRQHRSAMIFSYGREISKEEVGTGAGFEPAH